MRILEKKKEYKEVIAEKEKKICDKCRIEIEKPNDFPYEIKDFQLSYEIGYLYSRDRDTNIFHVELCEDCVKFLFELLKNNGIRINEINSDDYYDNIKG